LLTAVKKHVKKFVHLATAPEADQINPAYDNQSEPSSLKQFLHPSGFLVNIRPLQLAMNIRSVLKILQYPAIIY
jgi:hypothetical protein